MVGEHIRALKGGRWNHAIDCGDETVIHLAAEAGTPARVRRSYRPEFVLGAEAVEVVTHRERTFPASEVVARAYSRLSDLALASVFRDSEAFAEWCTTGRLPAGPVNVAVAVPGVARASPPAPAAKAAAPKPAALGAPGRSAPATAKSPREKAAALKAKARRKPKGPKRARKAPARKKPARRAARARRR